MKTLRINRDGRSIKLVNDIIKSEMMDVDVTYETDACGDDIIIIKGCVEEVDTLKEIYNMVY